MSLGTFQKEPLTLKTSKQPEHEATSQVKSKLENSTTACASVLVPAGPCPSCAGHAAAKGTESANVPGLWVRGGCSPLSTRSVSPSGCSYCQGNLGSGETPAYWPEGKVSSGSNTRHFDMPCRGGGWGEEEVCRARARSRQACPHHCQPTRQLPLGLARLLFFLIPMLMLTSRPIAFPSIQLRPQGARLRVTRHPQSLDFLHSDHPQEGHRAAQVATGSSYS